MKRLWLILLFIIGCGVKDGLYTEYWKNEQIKIKGTYKDKKRDGLWIEWFENGQKAEEVIYINDEPDGWWIKWHENGQKKMFTKVILWES